MESILTNDKILKTRPDWHIDAKWIVSLLLIFVFAITFLVFNLFVLTKKDNAIGISSALLAAMFSRGDSTNDIEPIRKAIKESPDKALKPFPGLDIKITEHDLDKSSVKEIKQRLFTELAASIYDYNSAPSRSKDKNTNSASQLGFMVIFTSEGHNFIGKILTVSLIISFALLLFSIWFSAGFGKAITPGVIFLIIGFLPTVILFLINLSGSKPLPIVDGSEADLKQQLSVLLASIAPLISKVCFVNYLVLTLTGLSLVILGISGRLVQRSKAPKAIRAVGK